MQPRYFRQSHTDGAHTWYSPDVLTKSVLRGFSSTVRQRPGESAKNYLLYLQENMAKFVKVILFLLLAVALHGVAGNVFTEKQVEQPEHAVTYSMKPQGQINAPESPYLPVAELTNLQSHQISVTRIQRVQIGEYFSSLRNVLQCCADRDNSLSQHWGRIYNTTTSYYCQPASEYYVFTLRHIII